MSSELSQPFLTESEEDGVDGEALDLGLEGDGLVVGPAALLLQTRGRLHVHEAADVAGVEEGDLLGVVLHRQTRVQGVGIPETGNFS